MTVMNKRHKEILNCVVDSFISSSQPISSSMVMERLSIQLSSATVRQIFSVLDKGGYVEKLHTSSGRVPTDKGYRAYVSDHLNNQPDINLNHYVSGNTYQMKFKCLFEQMLTNIAAQLPYVCMIWLNRHALSDIAALKYVPISSQYGLVVLFHRVGIVSEHYVRFETDVSLCKTDELILTLLDCLKQNTDEPLQQFSAADAHFLATILEAIRQQLVQHSVWEDRLIRNVKQCLSLPDYADKADVEQLLDVLDDQPFMDALMMPTVASPSFALKIGQELNDPRLMQSSFVSIPISMDDVGIAQLGILGPRRMDYQRIQQLFSCDKTLAELIQV